MSPVFRTKRFGSDNALAKFINSVRDAELIADGPFTIEHLQLAYYDKARITGGDYEWVLAYWIDERVKNGG